MDKRPVVHVVDDEADGRESLRMLLLSVGIDVTTYPNADSFLRDYRHDSNNPGCLLLDVRMPGISGMSLLERLHDDDVRLRVIMLTGHGDIPMSVQAMKLGAVDFLTKPYNPQNLVDLVQRVLREPADSEPEDAVRIAPQEARQLWESLTERERDVFERIVDGSPNKVVASDLGISVRTVESHRARIMDKLGARSLVDLVLLNLSRKRCA